MLKELEKKDKIEEYKNKSNFNLRDEISAEMENRVDHQN